VIARHALVRHEIVEDQPLEGDGLAHAIALQPRLVEVFAESRDGAGSGFVLAQIGALARSGRLLWVQDRLSIRDHGRPYPHWRRGRARNGFIHVAARDAAQALWAMEEGLRCADLSAVIGEIAGNPRALDFTATRRLAVAAERFGIPVFLLRWDAQADLSGARMRWRASGRPSRPPRWNRDAPGEPAWALELFRARGARPGHWQVAHDRTADRLDLVPAPGDPALAEGAPRVGRN
jgi:protein ImuA